jgi:hypothetical protein
MVGDQYEAFLRCPIQQRIDIEVRKAELGDRLDPFRREWVCGQLRIRAKRET